MNTNARIATVCQGNSFCRTIAGNRQYILKILHQVFLQKPDLVCLPEAFTVKGVPLESLEEAAEPVPGPTLDLLAGLAKENRCYIICPIYTKRDEKFRNSAVVIDRRGEIAGIYDKVHPAATSYDYTVFENGVTPGEGSPVFDLDFGRIGIQICLDARFPAEWQKMAKKGVKAVFWPAAYNGGLMLPGYASLFHYYVISSVRTDKARIINPCGEIVSETSPGVNYAVANINFDFIAAGVEFNHSIPRQISKKYPHQVQVRLYPDQGTFLVEPLDKGITVQQLQKEFAFEPLSQFILRHQKSYRQIQKGITPVPQEALHGSRPCQEKD